ncbi:flagellar hook-basal body protein [Ruminococcus sp. NK3A76]|uniref:flagellar hook-basal body protein n=1 Tax=Ruminococcus sp. NK3A76 TaxID=877411 RepID=UPI00048FBAEF|nr:flagellar hook-basal body protein [Ruminococcus sp. NK3A76]
MNIAFYVGRSGIIAHSNSLNISAQNVTNVSSIGYKATTTDFRELIYNQMDQNINKQLDNEHKILNGHGVKVQSDPLQFSQGQFQMTEYDLDFALASDNCLFAVDRRGTTQYTRNGAFDASVEGDNIYLVTTDGAYVLDNNNQKITIPKDETGRLDIEGLKDRIGVFYFENPYALFRYDGQSFAPTAESGEPQVATPGQYDILQGAIERSNTNLAKEMSDIIVTQKAYAFSAKVVQTADEVEDIVNNLRQG